MEQFYIWIYAVILLVVPVFVVGKLSPVRQWRIRFLAALLLIVLVWLPVTEGKIALKLMLTAVALGIIWERFRAFRKEGQQSSPD
jgi:hypothetical protein